MKYPFCIGITGASGAVYSVRLLEVLLAGGHDVHLSVSPAGRDVLAQELNIKIDLDNFQLESLLGELPIHPADTNIALLQRPGDAPNGSSGTLGESGRRGKLQYHHWQDYMAPIASGSFLTGGMVVCPCSGSTLSAIASGGSGNLIQRAAEVHLKERRRLVLVPRETPLSLPYIDNMRRAAEAGAVVLPASPGWYHGVASLKDIVDFLVGRICDQLGIENQLMKRWGHS